MVDTKLIKAAGEHWACSVLARLGWSPALTRDGVARTDILATWPDDGHMVEIQIKTASFMREPRWVMSAKAQLLARSDHEWFVLVALAQRPTDAPRSFVVPRDHVAAGVFIAHTNWLTEPGVPPGKRNTPLDGARTSLKVFERYENRWELLRASTEDAPVLLPEEFRAYATADRVGLPSGHPREAGLPPWGE